MNEILHRINRKPDLTSEEKLYHLKSLLSRANTLRTSLSNRYIDERSKYIAQQYNILRDAIAYLVDDPKFKKDFPRVWQFKPYIHMPLLGAIIISLYIILAYILPATEIFWGFVFFLAIVFGALLVSLNTSHYPRKFTSDPWFFAGKIGEIGINLDLMVEYLEIYLSYKEYPTIQERRIERLQDAIKNLEYKLSERDDNIKKLKSDLANFQDQKRNYLELETNFYETLEKLSLAEKQLEDKSFLFPNNSDPNNGPLFNRGDLLQLLDDKLNLEDFKTLSFEMLIEYENLGGDGKKAKIREFIKQVQQKNRLIELFTHIKSNYSYIPLEDLFK